MDQKTVVVGMSGGVDSSVAAYLLKEQGYRVIGVTMQIWQDEEQAVMEENGGCCGLSAVDDARRVAARLEIPYYVMNFKREFKEQVIDYFVEEYAAGRTPNPCIACNRYVKWEALLERSMAIGADYIATGHYARVEQLSDGRYAIKNRPMQQVREAIVATTSQVLTSFALSELPRYALQTPATVKLQCVTTAQADRIEMLPMIKRIDGRTVSFVGETMKDVMNGIVAVVGLGGTSY